MDYSPESLSKAISPVHYSKTEFAALSDVLIKEISLILRGALDGSNSKYRTQLGYINWNLVEDDFRKLIASYAH